MDVLQRQDVQATVHVERNRHLVPDRATADAFVYRTGDVTFPGPLYPTVTADKAVDISRLGGDGPVQRSLNGHLSEFFGELLANNTQPSLTCQVEIVYRYSLNTQLDDVQLPVLFQPPLTINVSSRATGHGSLAGMIGTWAAAISSWFDTHVPLGSGRLGFDLAVMSDLTATPMPLLRMPRLFLPIEHVVPPLHCREN